jgi:hypothetical protein
MARDFVRWRGQSACASRVSMEHSYLGIFPVGFATCALT